MKHIFFMYLAGAIVTKYLVAGTTADTTQNVIEWPVLWLNNFEALASQVRMKLQGTSGGGTGMLSQGNPAVSAYPAAGSPAFGAPVPNCTC